MKIAFIEPFLFRYARGIERFTLELSNHLAGKGVDVSILTWRQKDKYQLVQINQHIHIHEIPTFRYFTAQTVIPYYIYHLLRHNYDIVNIFFARYGEAASIAIASRFKRIKYNVNFHYPIQEVPHQYRKFKTSGLVSKADALVSVSRFVSYGATACFEREGIVIYNGVDCEKFRKLTDRPPRIGNLKIPADQKILLTVAALEERKGVQKVIEALPLVLKRYPDCIYIVLGEGQYRSHLQVLIEQLSLAGKVILPGAVDDIVPYYSAADVFLLLARGEAFGLSVVEAMACELPVIVSNQDPFTEIVDMTCGIFVDENTPAQVSGAIIRMLSDVKLRAEFGKQGRQKVVKFFSWERTADSYIDLFKSQLKT